MPSDVGVEGICFGSSLRHPLNLGALELAVHLLFLRDGPSSSSRGLSLGCGSLPSDSSNLLVLCILCLINVETTVAMALYWIPLR